MDPAIRPFRDWAFHRLGSLEAEPRAPLIALHGFTGSGVDFAPLAAELPQFEWWAPDLPGHGSTCLAPADAAFALPGMAEVVEAFSTTLARPPWILGYSMGGRLAVEIATRGRIPLQGLILVGASPGLRTEAERKRRREEDASIAARLRSDGISAFAHFWEAHPIIQSQQRVDDSIRKAMSQRRREQSAEGLARSLLGAGTGSMRDRWQDLPKIKCPTYLVTGVDDIKFGATASDMAALIPEAHHAALPGAGHCAHLENRPKFVHLMQQISS